MQADFANVGSCSMPHASAIPHGLSPTSNHQIAQIDLQRHGNPLEHINRAGFLAAFNFREVGLRNACSCGKLHHGHTAIFAIGTDTTVCLGELDNQLMGPCFLPGPEADQDSFGFKPVDQVFIVFFTKETVIFALNGQFLDVAHSALILVNAAARSRIDDHNNDAQIIDDNAFLANSDTVQRASFEFLDINSLSARISLQLGENRRLAFWLHVRQDFFRFARVADHLHGKNIALSNISVNQNNYGRYGLLN
jgi:hypothetical protein